MKVIVIGGGIAGVTTAYWLHTHGHAVHLIDRHTTVAQEATFGQNGLLLPSPLNAGFNLADVRGLTEQLDLPGLRQGWLARHRPFAPHFKKHDAQQRMDHFAEQYTVLKSLIDLSREALLQIEELHRFDYEQRTGVLHVFKTQYDLQCIRSGLLLLAQHQYPHRLLDNAACNKEEPTLSTEPFAGGVILQKERSGNCPLFTKRLKKLLDEAGVELLLGHEALNVRADETHAYVDVVPSSLARDTHLQNATASSANKPQTQASQTLQADAVVIAGGVHSLPILSKLRLPKMPLQAVRFHAMTAHIANEESAPMLAVVDSIQHTTLVRMNRRIRVAGAPMIDNPRQSETNAYKIRDQALEKIEQTAYDWMPGVIKHSTSHSWDDTQLLSEDGRPVVGALEIPRLFVNLAHGPSGWGLACGCAKIIADMISQQPTGLEDDSLEAIAPSRFYAKPKIEKVEVEAEETAELELESLPEITAHMIKPK